MTNKKITGVAPNSGVVPAKLKLAYNFQGGKDVGLFTRYSQLQVESIEQIIADCNKYGLTRQQTAYVLATAYHEAYNPSVANSRITPITEFGSESYLKGKKYYPYIGRGFVQLTWEENYRKQSKRLGIDLVDSPHLALTVWIASDILVHGMLHGSFTGRKLSHYINDSNVDYIGARRIINGTDKASLIAGYANKFDIVIVKG